MKLNKLLRKHSRKLIIVSMSFLLIVFLVPDTLQRLGSGGGQDVTRGRAFGRDVTRQDIERTKSELRMVDQMGLSVPGVSDEWALISFLMMEEARQAGIHVGIDEVRGLLANAGATDARMQQLQNSYGLSYDNMFAVAGKWLAVVRLAGLQSGAIVDSIPRQEVSFRDQTQEATAKVSIIPSGAFLHLVPEPTEEELLAFFEERKDAETAHTEQELIFGYKLPDRVKVEFLTVDPAQIEKHVKVKSLQVKRFFEENQVRYTKPDTLAPPSQPGQPTPQVPMTLEEARDQVRSDCRTASAIEEAQRLVNDIYNSVHRPWTATAEDENGFNMAPEGGVVSFEELSKQFSTEYDIEYGQTELATAADLQSKYEFGRAGCAVEQGRRILGADLAFRVRGILDKNPRDGQPAFNLMEPAPVILTNKFDAKLRVSTPHRAYCFRVIEVAPSAPPASLDVVREQVVEDWKLAKAHELARAAAEALASTAREVGLAAAVEQATELKNALTAAAEASTEARKPDYTRDLTPFSPQRLTRKAGFVQRLGQVTEFPKAVFALADQGDSDHRMATIPIASQSKWIVVELEEIKLIYAGPFEQQLFRAAMTAGQAGGSFFAGWMNPDNVIQRTGFEPDARFAPQPEESEESEEPKTS